MELMKKTCWKILVLLGAAIVLSCTNDESATGPKEERSSSTDLKKDSVEGMVGVAAKGAVVVLGTNSFAAKPVEMPQMHVELTYDYSIGRHEVLCSDFNNLMSPKFGLALDCPGDSIPAANVTFFDAILYTNELSKSRNLDTSYTYTAAEFDSEKHCVLLKGFLLNAKSEGFRLPTEAEWILAASQNWTPQKSWNGENSGGHVHEVCSFQKNEKALCDMAGNLLEWVSDWQGAFRDTTVKNYVGAVDGGPLGSCVVKGGDFYSAPSSMELYSRGDTYPVLYSSRASYVGFRLAKGNIPDALWMSGSNAAVTTPVVILKDKSELLSLTHSYKAKLAFRNDESGNLMYVNYGSKTPVVVEVDDTVNVYHPEISPDGHYVAFCTSVEGTSGKSSLYVRPLDADASGMVMLDVESAAIPRWRVNENGDTLIVYVSSAGSNKKESFLQESTWQVPFAKGKFGKPEKLFDGAYHGGVSDDGLLAVTGSPLLRARMSLGGKAIDSVWYGGDQACNASLSKDGSKRILFLDFAGKEGVSFAKEKYGVHGQILVSDSVGKLIQMVPASGAYTFDHTEWVSATSKNQTNDLVISTLTNANGAHQEIALVDLADSSVVPLVSGGELWHPSLWVESKDSKKPLAVNLDSAGVYFENNASNVYVHSSVELGMKLQSFWKKRNDVELVTLGSSMLMDAVIDDSIKTYNALNMGVTLTDVHLFEYLVRNYILPYAPKIKVLVVELAPGFLFRSREDMLDILISYSPGLRYDENHLSPETVSEIAENSFDQDYPKDLFSQMYMEGTFLLPSLTWNYPSVVEAAEFMSYDSDKVQGALAAFESIKRMADSSGVKVIAAITPRNPGYRDTEYFCYFGPKKDVAHKLIDDVEKMGIVIFDENKDGLHDYTEEMAFNTNHVSYLGAAQFSVRLDSLLATLPVGK